LDCHASAAQYLDSAFRNLPKGGILAITTTDDALHSNAEIALKNYGGVVTRTFYSKELAVRLIVAAVARFVQCSRTFDRGTYLKWCALYPVHGHGRFIAFKSCICQDIM
jgi:tRNA G26 N,N-dimethylase Trm1